MKCYLQAINLERGRGHRKKFMKMVRNSRLIVTILSAALLVFGCTNRSGVPNDINAYKVESNKGWENAPKLDTSNCEGLDLYFLNNPYGFKENFNGPCP